MAPCSNFRSTVVGVGAAVATLGTLMASMKAQKKTTIAVCTRLIRRRRGGV